MRKKKLAELDLAKQAQNTAAQVARTAQLSARSAQEGFSRFVEGPHNDRSGDGLMDDSHKSFWDDFSALADRSPGLEAKAPGGAIGTSAMGKAGAGAGIGGAGAGGAGTGARPVKDADDWDDW